MLNKKEKNKVIARLNKINFCEKDRDKIYEFTDWLMDLDY